MTFSLSTPCCNIAGNFPQAKKESFDQNIMNPSFKLGKWGAVLGEHSGIRRSEGISLDALDLIPTYKTLSSGSLLFSKSSLSW